jgi:preprotein translocase subunit SecE
MANPFEFIQQVRTEATKVHWPTRRETLITTAIVVAMAVVASFFLLAVDVALQNIVGFILGFGHSH